MASCAFPWASRTSRTWWRTWSGASWPPRRPGEAPHQRRGPGDSGPAEPGGPGRLAGPAPLRQRRGAERPSHPPRRPPRYPPPRGGPPGGGEAGGGRVIFLKGDHKAAPGPRKGRLGQANEANGTLEGRFRCDRGAGNYLPAVSLV